MIKYSFLLLIFLFPKLGYCNVDQNTLRHYTYCSEKTKKLLTLLDSIHPHLTSKEEFSNQHPNKRVIRWCDQFMSGAKKRYTHYIKLENKLSEIDSNIIKSQKETGYLVGDITRHSVELSSYKNHDKSDDLSTLFRMMKKYIWRFKDDLNLFAESLKEIHKTYIEE